LPGGSAPFASVGGTVLVDGLPAGPTVAPGRHLVQAGGATWLADLRGPVVAVAPGIDPRSLDDAARIEALRALLPGEPAAYLVVGDEVARVDLATGASRPIDAAPPPERRRWEGIAIGVGAAGLAAGLLDVGLASAASGRAQDAGWSAADLTGWSEARSDHRTATAWWAAGWGVAAVGAGLTVSGTWSLAHR
jgi:hypothetical protein